MVVMLLIAFCGQRGGGSICQHPETSAPVCTPGPAPRRWRHTCVSRQYSVLASRACGCVRERASVCACVSTCGNSITPAPGADPLCKHSHQREDKKLVKMIRGQRRGPCVGREDVVGQVRMKIFHAWSEALLGTNQNPLLQTSCEGRISHKYLVLLKASIC